MDADSPTTPALPTRLRRALELVYAVEGVVGARVWQWPGGVAVGVSVGPTSSPALALRRAEAAVAPIRLPEETWHFGLLGGA